MALILRGGGDDIIRAGKGRDTVFSGAGDDVVHGGAGDDALFGGLGDDTLDGGAGADLVLGGWGADTAIFNLSENTRASSGRGRDERDVYDGGAGEDLLRLELTADEWSRPEVQAEILAYHDFLATEDREEEFFFATLRLTVSRFEALELYVDGVLVNPAVQVVDLSSSTSDETVIITSATGSEVTTGSGSDTVTGGDGNDTISTGTGDDLITAGGGDDVVFAGAGNDTIVAGVGGGNDYFDGGDGINTITYPSLSEAEPVIIDLNAEDRSDNAEVVSLLEEQGLSANTPVGFARDLPPDIPPAEGGINIDVLISFENAVGGRGSDSILGNEGDNMLDGGLAGNDTLTGGAGSDTLFGGDGADQLNGGEDSDFLSGAAGDDTINGDGGYDTLILSGNRSDYVISVSGGGRYSVTDLRANGDGVDDISQIESIAFADVTVGLWTFVGSIDVMGTSGDDVFSPGTAARERFFGLARNDSISGGQEEDDFIGGAGNDTLHGGGPNDPENQDDLNFVWDIVNYAREYRIAIDEGIVAQGVTVELATGQATDTYGDTDTLFEIERVFGTPLADRIDGSDADEAFDPHGGADTINGGAGWDNLNYHLTDGYHGGGTHGITVEFSASVVGSGTVIDPLGNTDEFSGIEVVRGTRFDDVFVGGAGEQQFRGFRGDDRFDGGAGFTTVTYHDDANYGGDRGISFDLSVVDALGFATVTDGFLDTDLLRGINRIRGTGGADSMSGDGADNQFIGDAGNDVLSGAGGADILQAGFGDDTLAGGAQDDRLDGGVGLDQLNGGTGSDTLMGGFDADRFLFAAGDGDDVIEDFAVGADQLVLLGGITIATLVESDVNGDGGIDTTVNLSSGDSIVLLHVEGVTDPSDLL